MGVDTRAVIVVGYTYDEICRKYTTNGKNQ